MSTLLNVLTSVLLLLPTVTWALFGLRRSGLHAADRLIFSLAGTLTVSGAVLYIANLFGIPINRLTMSILMVVLSVPPLLNTYAVKNRLRRFWAGARSIERRQP